MGYRYDGPVPTFAIRTYGDPVLRQRAHEVEEIDGALVGLVEGMLDAMYQAPGTGLAATQVGVQRRVFVYDVGDGPRVVVNPRIVGTEGEWCYDEGCLSIPGLSWPVVRPDVVQLTGVDLEGNQLELEAGELEGRVFQHELDHLDGILLIERLTQDQRREAKRVLRARALQIGDPDPDGLQALVR